MPPSPATTPADPLPTDPSWSGGRVLSDVQETTADASVDALFRTVEGIGGGRGWYTTSLLWSIRGVADKLVGGVGMRRGRRDPDRPVGGRRRRLLAGRGRRARPS